VHVLRRTGAHRGFARDKERDVKRIFLAIGSLALVAMLGISLMSAGTAAQDPATPEAGESTATETKESAKGAYLVALAANLGVTTEELQAAIDATNTELGSEGGFMGGMGDGHRGGRDESRGGMRGPGGSSFLRGIESADAATFLGITEDELKTELDSSSFLEIAEAYGKTTEEVRAFLIQQATEQIDERLQAASEAPASDGAADEPAEESTTISEATEVPADPALTPTATS
jgi:hypothetical protein